MKEVITSRQNPQIKSVCALEDKKERRKRGVFRFDGIKLFCDAVGRVDIESVYVREPARESVEAAIDSAVKQGNVSPDRIVYVSDGVFDKLTSESSPEGIVTVARLCIGLHKSVGKNDLCDLDGKRILIAESLRDPGNLGTVMRSCAALGIDTLVLTDDCADLYNPKTVRSAMGALFRLNTVTVKQSELPDVITELRRKGRSVYAAALRDNAERIGELELKEGDCFVIGNEGHGLSDKVIDACDKTAIIPMVEGNESLNAAAASVILMWEMQKANK